MFPGGPKFTNYSTVPFFKLASKLVLVNFQKKKNKPDRPRYSV